MPTEQADTFAEAAADSYDLQGQLYVQSRLKSIWAKDEGKLVIPVMGPAGTPPVIARVHAPYGTRKVVFSYAKDGSPPVYPAAADSRSGDTILASELATPAPVELADGRLRFGIAGTYVYVQPGTGRGTEDTLPIDRHPFFTGIDMLGLYTRYQAGEDVQGGVGTYNTGVLDSRYLSSYGIIG